MDALAVPILTIKFEWMASIQTNGMKLESIGMFVALSLFLSGCGQQKQIVWNLDNLEEIAGHEVMIEGDPKVIDTPNGKAIEFDGIDDGIFLDVHPLAGLSEFTVEVIFNPYLNGAPEQRFFHMEENSTENRVMFETRLVTDGLWFMDTFIKSGETNIPLFAENDKHQIGPWYHAAIVMDGERFMHFVDGRMELREAIDYSPQGSGRTSLGVRINKVHWFKGAIRTARFTGRALKPEEFLTAED